MDIILKNAILHVLNNDGGESHISTQELDIDSDVCYEFINKHVKKLIDNPGTKEATFNAESKIYSAVNAFKTGAMFFRDAGAKICKELLDIMQTNVDIPSGDILIVHFEIKNDFYFAILKLNYKECYTHQVENNEHGTDNQIVKYRAVLPFDVGKVEEACLIPFDPMIIKLVEKPYLVDGEPTNYFSELFLDCSTELSKKEAVQIINDVTEEICGKYFNESVEAHAKVKTALIEQAEEAEGYISIESVAAKAFGDNDEIKNEYIALARESGIKKDLSFGERFTKQQFSSQKFKSENGIEIKFPAELLQDPNSIEIITNPDGSFSFMLKNLRKSKK